MSQFLQTLKKQNKHVYLQFGGQGSPWLKELSKFYHQESNLFDTFFNVVLDTLESELSKLDKVDVLSEGLDLRSWLNDIESVPSDDYLSMASVSLPMIFITQMAHYENLHISKCDRSILLEQTVALSGHSQGLINATLVALKKTGDDYYKALADYTKYMLYIGIRAQQTYPFIFATNDEKTQSEELGAKDPAPMVAILGKEHSDIENFVKEFNSTVNDEEKLYVNLYNTPQNRIVSGTRKSLIQFHFKLKDLIDLKELKYVYLKSTCPFHSPYLENILEPFLQDCTAIEFNYTGADLKLPVYSFVDGSNLQNAENSLAEVLCRALMLQTLHWDKALEPLKNQISCNYIIDFGPGKVSQRLTSDVISSFGIEDLPVLAVAFPKDLSKLVE